MPQINDYPELLQIDDGDFILAWNSAASFTGKIKISTLKTYIGVAAIPAANIASTAVATASSSYGGGYTPDKAIDGNLGSEWASLGQLNPWIQLDFPGIRTVSKIRISDRTNPNESANGGILSFSDGSSLNIDGIPDSGTFKEINFAARKITWVRFQITGGTGVNVGLSEFEVWGF